MDPKKRVSAPVEATRQQVARVLNHTSFSRSRGPARLLTYLADQLASGGGCPATQTDLARVLGLPEGFDPNRNPLVRMHMSKLRRMLDRYARGDGRHDAVILEIPRNNYRLVGLLAATMEAATGPSESVLAPPARPQRDGGRTMLMVVEFEGFANSDGVMEFSMTAGAEAGPSHPHAAFSRDLAFWLVAELFDHPRMAAIGPLLQERVRSDRATISGIAQRCGARHVLTGTFAEGRRGLQLGVRVVDTATGSTVWTLWMDDPTDLIVDNAGRAARKLATRLVDRLKECPLADRVPPPLIYDAGLHDVATPLAVRMGRS